MFVFILSYLLTHPDPLLDMERLRRVRDLAASGGARGLRLAAGLSLGELGRAVGVSGSTILRWENAERTPRGQLALRYAEALERLAQPSSRSSVGGRR